MDWKAILLGAAGVAGAPFTGGASLALVPAAISMHNAGKATEQQTQAATQAQGQLAQVQQQANASLAPFAALGANAAGELNSRLGFGNLPTNLASVAASRPMTGPQGQAFTTVDPGNPNGTVTNGKAPLVAPPSAADVAGQNYFRRALADQARRSASASGYMGTGRMVTLRAPDGTTESVPAEQAQHYVDKGAQIVKVL